MRLVRFPPEVGDIVRIVGGPPRGLGSVRVEARRSHGVAHRDLSDRRRGRFRPAAVLPLKAAVRKAQSLQPAVRKAQSLEAAVRKAQSLEAAVRKAQSREAAVRKTQSLEDGDMVTAVIALMDAGD